MLRNPEDCRAGSDDGILITLVEERESGEDPTSRTVPGVRLYEEGSFLARGGEMDLPALDLQD